MRSFWGQPFNRFKAWNWAKTFFLVTITISSWTIEFISFRKLISRFILFCVSIWSLFNKIISISGHSKERLLIWIKLFILISRPIFLNTLPWIIQFIFWNSLKRNISVLIFYSWNYFLPHLWFMPWIIFSIWGINVIVRLIWFRFYIEYKFYFMRVA